MNRPSTRLLRLHGTAGRWALAFTASALLAWTALAADVPRSVARALQAAAADPCPASPPASPANLNVNGKTLLNCNFSGWDLTNADFSNATLQNAVFIRTNLTGAKFDGATIASNIGDTALLSNFSFAVLTHASFKQVTFVKPVYFTYATLTCADFSQTDIGNGNAVFGDQPLRYDASANCRIKFQSATMSCEFIDQWRAFDLTGANLSACLTQLSGRDFSGTVLSGVNLEGAVLDGTSFAGADLTKAVLNGASLQCLKPGSATQQCVDLSNAKLQGAFLNKANLTGASLYNAFLSSNVNDNISDTATLVQAHLKNVNLAFAQLAGVNFTNANFYGKLAANSLPCKTTAPNNAGFTIGCASAHNAGLQAAIFDGAYLYGVDFSGADIRGANFNQAVLSGANFAGASVGSFVPSGSRTKFTRAHLEGTNLDEVDTKDSPLDADLSDAFVDVRSGGNTIYIQLNGANHNGFACPSPSGCKPVSGKDVCVWVSYPKTTLPANVTTITCPDGNPAGSGGCGAAGASNLRWKSSLAPGAPPPGLPPAWYVNDATYTKMSTDTKLICGGLTINPKIVLW